jgi:carotenoid cleavage dioxygenase-like enzyme
VSDQTVHPGFRSLETECHDYEPAIEGEIPSWLSGTLVRNGPALFDTGDGQVRHWFDGLAMLRRYEFADGTLRYSNRFLRTESYTEATEGTLTGQFGTDSTGFSKLRSVLSSLGPPAVTDNANVHVAEIGGEFVALTEVPRWQTFDRDTLETTGEFVFEDLFDPHMTTAHLVEDPDTGDHFGHALTFGRTHEYHLFRIPAGTARREVFASIPTDSPAYVHSIGVTESTLVLVETPLRIDLRGVVSPFTDGFFDLLEWDPERGTTLYVVDRDSGETLTTTTTDAWFTFHTANAYDDGDDVVLDLVRFPDDSIVDALTLDALTAGAFEMAPPGRLVRLRMSSDGTLTEHRLYDGGIEMPGVVADRRTRQHRYVYGQATDREGANGLVKVDTQTAQASEWWQRDLYIEEPRPVQCPDGTAEDDGVVLATGLDVAAERSVLLVFDAASLELLARAELSHCNPFGFHGRFFER